MKENGKSNNKTHGKANGHGTMNPLPILQPESSQETQGVSGD